MLSEHPDPLAGGIFITFSGNCKEALTFYQLCFGGELSFETFDEALYCRKNRPVIIGSLISERITIHGSDLVHECGRRTGNHLSIFLPCKNNEDRDILIHRLRYSRDHNQENYEEQQLIEITDAFDVTWVLSI